MGTFWGFHRDLSSGHLQVEQPVSLWAWCEAAHVLPRPGAVGTVPLHPALYLFSLSCEGASSTRWVAPRMPGQPLCSVSQWQRDTPSLCSAWMPPMSCSSRAPKVGDGQGGCRCCGSRGSVGITGMVPVFSVEPCPCAGPGWLLSSGPVGGGTCSEGILSPSHHALGGDTPNTPGLFFLPQTAAARCGTW